MALFVLSGCGNEEPPLLPTPDLDILVPTATAMTARVEVVIIVVTPTAAAATPASMDVDRCPLFKIRSPIRRSLL